MSIKIQGPKLLIVEGRDDGMFFEAALARHLGLTDIQVMPIGGKTLLTTNLAGLVNDPLFPTVQSLAVVRDADATVPGSAVSSAAQAMQSVRGSLIHVGLPHPAAHGQFAAGPPRVGVFIVPNGIDDGMLETLCLLSVSTLPEFACVDGYFQCLQGYQIVPNNLPKARAHAWLASRPEADKRVGEAAQAGYWPWDSDAFAELWSFVRSL
jgi:Protein of unknown function (DUF3226)